MLMTLCCLRSWNASALLDDELYLFIKPVRHRGVRRYLGQTLGRTPAFFDPSGTSRLTEVVNDPKLEEELTVSEGHLYYLLKTEQSQFAAYHVETNTGKIVFNIPIIAYSMCLNESNLLRRRGRRIYEQTDDGRLLRTSVQRLRSSECSLEVGTSDDLTAGTAHAENDLIKDIDGCMHPQLRFLHV